MKKLIFILLFSLISMAQKPEELAQEQLDAYNKRDIEAFLKPYADDVEVYTFPDKLQYKGKDKMRESYMELFNELKDLHCTLVNRIVMGDKVIDEESVVFQKNKPKVRALVIYTIEENKIKKVHFIRGK